VLAVPSGFMATSLTEQERQILRDQYIDAYDSSQRAYDVTIRTLAAAGVAVTASLGTASKGLGGLGGAAIACFLVSLAANVASYVSAQSDMKARILDLDAQRDAAAFGNWLTTATASLNYFAGLIFLVGGALLAFFVT
jgi:hypothetical protein